MGGSEGGDVGTADGVRVGFWMVAGDIVGFNVGALVVALSPIRSLRRRPTAIGELSSNLLRLDLRWSLVPEAAMKRSMK